MKLLLNDVRAVADTELGRAQVNHGKHYASPHEGYGVLTEELYEADTEVAHVGVIKTWLLTALHADDREQMLNALEELEERATLAACEYIQVAAVARKMVETLEKR